MSPPPPSPTTEDHYYCRFSGVGWCLGGSNTPVANADGSQPTSLGECWGLCAVQFGTSLVSADFWPNSPSNNDERLCWCQEACTSITQDYQSDEHPAHLAIAPGSIPPSSGLNL